MLRKIAKNPNEQAPYREAIAYFQKRGMTAQAAAIQQALQHHFQAVQ